MYMCVFGFEMWCDVIRQTKNMESKERKDMKLLTVFTPTFNRAYCLSKCYESLKRQSCKSFIWLIVDDGSSDGTKELVEAWKEKDEGFDIKYVYKENGGMHTAYNVAYDNITTELSINVDSDDYLTDTAIEEIIRFWENNKRPDIGGIYALDCYENGEVVGLPFPDDLREFRGWGYKEIFYNVGGKRKKHINRGDKKFIGVTGIINKYPPFPVFEGEKYHSLYFKQHLIERDYSILIYNKPVCVVEYMADGSSRNMFYQYIRNPKGFCNERRFVMQYAPTIKLRMEAAIHYVAESMIAKDWSFISKSTNKPCTVAGIIPGAMLYMFIKWKTRS